MANETIDLNKLADSFTPDRNDPDYPLYQQAVDHISDLVDNGILRPKQMFPNERQPAQKLGLSLTTTRNAIRILHQQGKVIKKQSVGTFVAPPAGAPLTAKEIAVRNLADRIADQISSGSLTRGQKLPGELHMAHRYNVSLNTVREAYDILREHELIVQRPSDGTFVLEPPMGTYEKLANNLAIKIDAGEIREWLPGERSLAQTYNVSFRTIRRATEILKDQGRIYTIPGEGAFLR